MPDAPASNRMNAGPPVRSSSMRPSGNAWAWGGETFGASAPSIAAADVPSRFPCQIVNASALASSPTRHR